MVKEQDSDLDLDLIIVGAGPAGCSAALALRGGGLKIGLLDKSGFPRLKSCGDAIPGPAIMILQSMLPEEDLNTLFSLSHRISQSCVITPSGKVYTKKWQTTAINCRRDLFDNWLFQIVSKMPDIKVLDHTCVTQFVPGDTAVSLITSDQVQLTAKLVLACDGARSIFRSPSRPDVWNGLAISAYFTDIETTPAGNDFFLLPSDASGYLWMFPVDDKHWNVGIGTGKKNRQPLSRYFHELIRQHPVLKKRFVHAVQTSRFAAGQVAFHQGPKRYSGNRVLLCGDAAGLVDPLMGHGIDKAVLSGQLAAEQARRCFETGDFSDGALRHYDQQIKARIEKELTQHRRVRSFLQLHPSVVPMILKLTKKAGIFD